MTNYILAVETGGTKLQMALGTAEGEIHFNYRTIIYPENGCQGILEDVIKAFPVLEEEAEKRDGKITKIGIGFGGPVDSNKGVVIASVQVPGWNGFSVMDFFKERVGIPAYIYNDSNAAAWGEYCRGTGRGTKNFFYTNLGSGVGGGLIIDGKLYDGQGYGAAEMGQTWLCDFGHGKGRPEKIENMCSGWAIEKKLRRAKIPADSILWKLCKGRQGELNCAMLGQAVKAGDYYANDFLDHIAQIFSVALSNIISLFSPECIAVGGGVSLIGEPLIERLRKYTDPFVFISSRNRYHIEKSRLDESIVLVGTLLLTGMK
ncbi:MAG: ROK family protein [Eubacteriales bacterium]|nr:ROK family protein [Eubacteriales bacterium]